MPRQSPPPLGYDSATDSDSYAPIQLPERQPKRQKHLSFDEVPPDIEINISDDEDRPPALSMYDTSVWNTETLDFSIPLPAAVNDGLDEVNDPTLKSRIQALHQAVFRNDLPEVCAIMTPDTIDGRDEDKSTALMIAAAAGFVDMALFLLNQGADKNAADIDGKTVFHDAIYSNNIEMVQLLLDAGVNIHTKDQNGWSALSIAEYNECTPAITALLRTHGATDEPFSPEEASDESSTWSPQPFQPNDPIYIDHLSDSDDDPDLQAVLTASRQQAEAEDTIGPRSLSNGILFDVDDDGNCFYHAVIEQLQRLHYSAFLDTVPADIKPYAYLRELIQGVDYQDKQWAEHETFHQLIQILPALILAVIDTKNPRAGFIAFYQAAGNIMTNTGLDPSLQVPPDKPIIYLASTGNHFLSVLTYDGSEDGAITTAFDRRTPAEVGATLAHQAAGSTEAQDTELSLSTNLTDKACTLFHASGTSRVHITPFPAPGYGH